MKTHLQINGKNYQIVTLDFETYYAQDYTLSGKNMNTSEYVRDPRFHAHGVGIKIGAGRTKWYTGKNIRLALEAIDWSRSAMLCHHTQFDAFICSHHYGIIAAFYLCTLSMSRAVHGHHVGHRLDDLAKRHGLAGKVLAAALVATKGKAQLTWQEERDLGAYCVNDCDDTAEIFHAMYNHFPDDELRLVDLTTRMFVRPLLYIDTPRVEAELAKEIGSKAEALAISGAAPSDLMSNPKFAALLEKAGAKLPMKLSPTTGEMTWAFAKSDLDFQELAKSPNKKIAALCAARLKTKSTIGETRAVRFLEAGKDGMRLPIYLNYYGAHTGRWSGGNKLNLQNLPRGGELRRAILAASGYAIVVADSSQIEARVLAWLAGEEWLIEAFRDGRDIYSEFASEIYDRPVDRKRPSKDKEGRFLNKAGIVVARKEDAHFPDYLEGFVGKVSILGLGYGMGAIKFDQTLRQGSMGPPVVLPDGMPAEVVQLYRRRNPKIVALWRKMDYIIFCMATGIEGTLGPISYGKGYIKLPNGLFLLYPDLQGTYDDRGRLTDATYANRRGRSKIYGGLLTENCLAGDTLVLTDSGWKYLAHVCAEDLVHDGVEFVSHGGLVFKSVQPCVIVDGVAMTADHEVLTDEGWRAASQNPEPNRPTLRNVGGKRGWAFGQAQAKMALRMPMWKPLLEGWDRTDKSDPQGPDTLMRMLYGKSDGRCTYDTWNEPASSVRSVAQHGRPLQTPDTSRLEALWRQGTASTHRLEHIRGILERYEGHVPNWINTGTNRQQQGLLQTELPLGDTSRASTQQAQFVERGHPDVVTRNGNLAVDALLSIGPRPVFDIVNAGPRQRFVVLGTDGPFIVHNCVQALARVIIGEQMLAVDDVKIPIVTMSHDEIVALARKAQADKVLALMLRIMGTPPAWAPDLPIAAEGGWDTNYSK